MDKLYDLTNVTSSEEAQKIALDAFYTKVENEGWLSFSIVRINDDISVYDFEGIAVDVPVGHTAYLLQQNDNGWSDIVVRHAYRLDDGTIEESSYEVLSAETKRLTIVKEGK